MTVFVDDMRMPYRGMVMCHLIADTDAELHDMVDRIGVSRRWHQAPPRHPSHYDIALSKRSLAVALGAREITMRQCSCMLRRRELTGTLGSPDDAVQWRRSLNSPGKSSSALNDRVSREL